MSQQLVKCCVVGRAGASRCGPAAVLVALAAGAAAGCGAADRAPTYAVRDSAGVQIVESTAPAWRAGGSWRVAAEPSLQIGVVDGPEEYQFSRIVGVERLADGRIVVADQRAAQLRFYDAEGRFLDAYGRPGSGPGEFRSMWWASAYRGDSLAVWDGGARRLTVIDPATRQGRTQTIELPQHRESGAGGVMAQLPGAVSGVFGDGTLLVTPHLWLPLEPGKASRPVVTFVRYSPEGEPLDTVARLLGPEILLRPPAPGNIAPPFPRRFVSAIHGVRFYYGPGEGYEIRVYTADGALERVIRASHRDLAMTEAARDAYREEQRSRAEDDATRAQIERALAEVEFPATLPPYERMLVDAEDHLWVQDYPCRAMRGRRRGACSPRRAGYSASSSCRRGSSRIRLAGISSSACGGTSWTCRTCGSTGWSGGEARGAFCGGALRPVPPLRPPGGWPRMLGGAQRAGFAAEQAPEAPAPPRRSFPQPSAGTAFASTSAARPPAIQLRSTPTMNTVPAPITLCQRKETWGARKVTAATALMPPISP